MKKAEACYWLIQIKLELIYELQRHEQLATESTDPEDIREWRKRQAASTKNKIDAVELAADQLTRGR